MASPTPLSCAVTISSRRRATHLLRGMLELLLASLAFVAPAAARAQPTARPLAEYFHTAWTRRDGAPAEIFALAQTTDGYLWLGSSTGLFRFDGVTFERYAARPGASPAEQNVASLFAASDGALWIGGIFGGVTRLLDGRVQTYGERDGLPASTVNRLARDASGAMLAATGAGLFRLQGAAWQRVGAAQGLPDGDVRTVHVDRRGTIWVHIKVRGFYSRTVGSARFVAHPFPQDDVYGGAIAESESGEIWIASQGHVLGAVDANDTLHAPPVVFAGANLSGYLHVDDESRLWVGTTSGFARLPPRGEIRKTRAPAIEEFTHRDGLSGDVMVASLTDREGTIWIGTNGGLDRFRRKKLMAIALPRGVVAPALSPDKSGALWIGNNSGSIVVVDDSTRLLPGEPSAVQATFRDEGGRLWVATENGEVWHATPSGFQQDAVPAEARGSPIQSLVYDREGALWISVVRRGVFRRAGEKWTAFGGSTTLPKLTAIRMTMDSSGALWFGYTDNRIARYDRGAVTLFGPVDGIDVGNVTTIQLSRGHVWIGGARGLQRLVNGHFRAVVSHDATPFLGITGIVECATGELWLNGGDGVTRIPAADVSTASPDSVTRVNYERFDALDGLTGVAPQLRPLPSAIAAPDGRLWFATSEGAFGVDPAMVRRNRVVPPVQIRAVIAGGASYRTRDSTSLPANTRSLQVQYTGLSLAIPERVRFRYQLVGSDTGWQDAGNRREAFYTNLGPGRYTFRVIASNDDGVWNEAGASTVITIPPTFVQTRLFLAFTIGASALLIWGAYRARLRTVSTRLEQLYNVRLAERTRIAEDLHDTLLQGFTGITLQLQGVRTAMPAEERGAAGALDRILGDADFALREARDAIWDLRTPELEHADVVDLLSAAAQSAVQGSGIELNVAVEGDRRAVSPATETALLRIGREGVMNAVQHADARTITLAFSFTERAIQLCITDDGSGIDIHAAASATRRGHWGIAGMRERAERLGGSLDVGRGSTRGTQVIVTLPITPPPARAGTSVKPAMRA